MHFLDLSDDIISRLIELEESCVLVIKLWLCGSKMLSTRLSRACTVFKTPTFVEDRILRNWPSLLQEFRFLRELKLVVHSIKGDILDVAHSFQNLPSTLHKVELKFLNAHFLPLTPQSILQFQSASDNLNFDNQEEFQDIVDLASAFPGLESVFFDTTSVDWSDLVLTGSSLDKLPPNLSYLSWPVRFILTEAEWSRLPRDLTFLNILLAPPPTALALDSLPPHLTHLDGVLLDDENLLRHLPRTLQSGSWLQGFSSYSSSIAALLPPATSTLNHPVLINTASFSSDHFAWIQSLPKFLTELVADAVLDVHGISLLPKTLTKLSYIRIEQHSIKGYQHYNRENRWDFWPPRLQTMHLLVASFQNFDPIVLPRTLTELSGIHFQSSCRIDTSSLPPNLTSLQISPEPGWRLLTCSGPWPSRLTVFQSKVHLLDPKYFSDLPTSLTHLDLQSKTLHEPINRRFVADLPRQLRFLHIRTIHSYCLIMLPRSLKVLKVANIYGVNNKEMFETLPSLTHLEYSRLSNEMEYSALAALPSTLTSLNLGKNTHRPSILEHLSPNILHLDAKIADTDLPLNLPLHWLTWLAETHYSDALITKAVKSAWPEGVPRHKHLL